MDYLSLIKEPIKAELDDFISLFNKSLTHTDNLQEEIFRRIRQRAGKRMRPMLILLMAKNYGSVSSATLHAAVGLELLHTASLVHDDVVDESTERRGQASVNALYDTRWQCSLATISFLRRCCMWLRHTSELDNQVFG